VDGFSGSLISGQAGAAQEFRDLAAKIEQTMLSGRNALLLSRFELSEIRSVLRVH
jgi:hypothetical protein